MNNRVRWLIILLGIIIYSAHLTLYSQVKEDVTQYDPQLTFTDGIYLSFENFRNNDPILKSQIISTEDYNSTNFFERLMKSPRFSYYDDYGTLHELSRSSIWGLTSNGITYILHQEMFVPLIIVGEISYFVAEKYNKAYRYDTRRMSTRFNYSDLISYLPVIRDPNVPMDIIYDPHAKSNREYIPFEYNQRLYEILEINVDHYVVDFETGEIMEANIRSMESILERDSRLYNEFDQLKRKQKKQLLQYYIIKYNENNPLNIDDGRVE
jgi:hypothetical protein